MSWSLKKISRNHDRDIAMTRYMATEKHRGKLAISHPENLIQIAYLPPPNPCDSEQIVKLSVDNLMSEATVYLVDWNKLADRRLSVSQLTLVPKDIQTRNKKRKFEMVQPSVQFKLDVKTDCNIQSKTPMQ